MQANPFKGNTKTVLCVWTDLTVECKMITSPSAEVLCNSRGDAGKGVLQLTRSQHCSTETHEGPEGGRLPGAGGFIVFFWKKEFTTGSEKPTSVLKALDLLRYNNSQLQVITEWLFSLEFLKKKMGNDMDTLAKQDWRGMSLFIVDFTLLYWKFWDVLQSCLRHPRVCLPLYLWAAHTRHGAAWTVFAGNVMCVFTKKQLLTICCCFSHVFFSCLQSLAWVVFPCNFSLLSTL